MAKKENIVDDQDLINAESEIDVEEAHDPMNAEVKSNDSVDKAAKTGPTAKKRTGDKAGGDKTAEKPDSGIVRELYNKMSSMKKEDLRKLHTAVMAEDFDVDEYVETDQADVLEGAAYDFSDDLDSLVESEATLSEEFKEKTAIIMETAIKSKLRIEIARLEESYAEQLEEEVESNRNTIIEQVDSYLNHVTEKWMEDNKLAVQSGLRTEIAENFMNSLKDLFTESYIEVPESKVDLVDDLSEQVVALEAELNGNVESMMNMKEELESFKRDNIIIEAAHGLADTQIDKLSALAEDVDFDDEDTFRAKIAVIKEAYFGKKTSTTKSFITDDVDNDADDTSNISDQMSAYVSHLKKSVQ